MPSRNALPVLVITATQNEAEQLNSVLRKAGHAVRPIWVANMDDAEKSLREQKPNLILCSVSVAGASFPDVVKLRDMTLPNVPIIALSDSTVPALIAEIIDTGARDLVSMQQAGHIQAVVSRELEVLQLARDLEQKSIGLREYEQRINLVVRESKDAIAYVNEGIHLNANPVYLGLFGYSSETIEGLPILELFDHKSHQAIKNALKACAKLEQGQSGEPLSVVGIHTDGKHFDTVLDLTKVEIDGELAIEVAIRNDRGAKKAQAQVQAQVQEQLDLLNQKLAASVQQLTTVRNLDLFTGLINRVHFIELLKQELTHERKQSVRALLYIRPDKFSALVGKVGVLASDGIIKEFADTLRSTAMDNDVVSRFGGTVFAVLLVRNKMKDVTDWTGKLLTIVAGRIFESSGKSTSLTCSIGYAQVDENDRDIERVLTNAHEAYDTARQAGGNQAVKWVPPVVDAEGRVTDAEWKRLLTDALKSNRFMLVYQPIASLAGDASEIHDILLRLRNEQDMEIPNKDFLPAAERTGTMIAIDRWVVERCFRLIQERSKQNNPSRLFVRLSDQSLTDKSLLPWLEKLLRGVFFSGGHLVFQIAEKSAEKYIADTRALAEGVRSLQCGFALEHFGIGQNPLHTLELVEYVDYIKMDGALTAALASDDLKRETVRNFVERAKALGIHTIAEKIEKPETMAVVYQLGMEYVQGNYLQEPEVVMADANHAPAAVG